jgi:hypothetical protein
MQRAVGQDLDLGAADPREWPPSTSSAKLLAMVCWP